MGRNEMKYYYLRDLGTYVKVSSTGYQIYLDGNWQEDKHNLVKSVCPEYNPFLSDHTLPNQDSIEEISYLDLIKGVDRIDDLSEQYDRELEILEEKAPAMTRDIVENWYADHHTEEGLAEAYAVANRVYLYYDVCIDNEREGTAAYNEACDRTAEWYFLKKMYEKEIFQILEKEDPFIRSKDIYTASTVHRFMSRYGYRKDTVMWFPKILFG